LAAAALLLSGFLFPAISGAINWPETDLFQPLVQTNTFRPGDLASDTTIKAFGGNFQIIIPASKATSTITLQTQQLGEDLPEPWSLERLSEFYQFDFKSSLPGNFKIRLNYKEGHKLADYKQVFYFDKNRAKWLPLPTIDHPDKSFVEATTSLTFARLAVFSYPGIMSTGRASWYKYKNGNFAASPDFPKGSILRVTNTANGKSVDVTINDFGPERDLFPDRVIDLDKVAFMNISPISKGVINNVTIQPLFIPADARNRILDIPVTGAGITPEVDAPSAIIMRASDGAILWEKNSTTTRPLASLSKIIAAKVFLDIADNRNRLDEKVAYSRQDAQHNYEYCNAWESASLDLKDGDKLTIRDLLYSSLVRSANNAVETLVRVSGLSRPDFIAKMNQEAKDLGAASTRFVEPTGLSPKNVSSARDYAIMVKVALSDPLLTKISSAPRYTFKSSSGQSFGGANTNFLFQVVNFQVSGSKTGYLNEAGYCLMTSVKDGKDNLIVVTLGAPTRDKSFNSTEELINYGLRQALPSAGN
jgi:D-alanyl-D-alanine endopeptidase (penicillin-binding protein 7)